MESILLYVYRHLYPIEYVNIQKEFFLSLYTPTEKYTTQESINMALLLVAAIKLGTNRKGHMDFEPN
jgi:hypothetical protein